MKNTIYHIILFLYLGTFTAQAQTVTYAFTNAQITNAGPFSSYEVDITISATADLRLGSGQLYFDYNPLAFGNSAVAAGQVTITTAGYILGEASGPFGIYSSFVTNDNSTSRLSFSWQQALSSECLAADNVTAAASALFHLRIDFLSGGAALDPGVCFTSAAPFDNQTFTACGTSGGTCGFPDCISAGGVQLTDDFFDCAASAPLPVELLSFDARAVGEQVQIDWATATELDNDYFLVQRSKDAERFEDIDQVDGAGTTLAAQYYEVWDNKPYIGINYYRLKQVDHNGDFEYSDIRAVEMSGQAVKVNVYPQPASDWLTVEVGEEVKPERIQLFNELGQLVMEEIAEDRDFRWNLEVQHLPRGLYMIRVGGETPIFTNKIILQ
ncbi:MAG: T9SS type A sorting domain-containing protein [Bacteroidota bacterium]